MAVRRQARVQKIAQAVLADGGHFAHVVLTVRHDRKQKLAALKSGVQSANRSARSGRGWKAIQEPMGAVGVTI
jgi:hypothetical protein